MPLMTAANQDSRTLARLLCTGAQGFLVAAEATHERHLYQSAGPEHWPAITVNLCFALELSLKALIALHGGNRQTLKKIGHDLNRGLEKASALGYSPEHPAVPDLIATLSPFHVNHSLRYLEKGAVELPETHNMIAIVRLHVRGVGLKIVTSTSI
jgi:hypothetical protein